ncbi:MAG: hypothetical protein K8M05_13950, partial [Deltaproteobacteria bacterium]|nr:hypothetical protein [Kofleriaceae bacterium]
EVSSVVTKGSFWSLQGGSSSVSQPRGSPFFLGGPRNRLLHNYRDTTAELLCGVEGVPITQSGAESLAKDYPPTRRSKVIKAAGLTSDDTRSHLMSFGEWMAMYLFVWSNTLWPAKSDIPSFWDVKAVVEAKLDQQGVSENERRKIIDEMLHARLNTDPVQRDNVLTLYDALPNARRALANVPTYMIFDDHEVTDDWNMNRKFCQNVYAHPMGRALIQNGLVAYSLCQHWGNTPEQFAPNAAGAAGATLLNLFSGATGGYNDIRDDPDVAKIVGVHTWTEMNTWTPPRAYHDTGVRWAHPEGWVDSATLIFNYTIESPAHQVIVTDSRTWREFPHGAYEQPHLIAEDQVAVQITNTLRNLDGRLPIMVLSTNAPPSPGIRQGGRDLPNAPIVGSDFYFFDFYDSWELEHVDWAQLVAAITRKFPLSGESRDGYALFLTGDVHSSSAQRIQVWSESQVGDTAPYKPARLVVAQLVGSSMHNESGDTIGQHESNNGYSWIPPKLVVKIAQQKVLLTEGFVGWNVDIGNNGDVVGELYNLVGAEEHYHNYRLDIHRPTRTLREETYPPPAVYKLQLDSVSRTPDHRIRLDYLRAVAGSGYITEPIVLDVGDAKKRRAQAARKYLNIVRGGHKLEIVGKSNLGEITFEQPNGGAITAKYTVRWRIDSTTILYVRWDVSLDVADVSYAQIPGP